MLFSGVNCIVPDYHVFGLTKFVWYCYHVYYVPGLLSKTQKEEYILHTDNYGTPIVSTVLGCLCYRTFCHILKSVNKVLCRFWANCKFPAVVMWNI